MQVRLIGPLRASGAIGELDAADFPSRKSRQVLAAVALAGGHPVSKDRLVDQIWSDRLPQNPAGALEQAVSVLRRALRAVTAEPVLLTRSGGYLLDPAVATVDLVDVTARLAAARGLDPVAREVALWDALVSVDAELLADQPTAPWVDRARERWRADLEEAWTEVARLAARRGDDQRAASAARRARSLALVVHDEAYAIEAAARARSGDHHRALELVDELERLVASEHRAPRLDLDALRASAGWAAPARTGVRTSIRPRADEPLDLPLVGRGAALDEISSGWDATSSVALVTAPAGYGRTRLLAELVERAGRRCTAVSVAGHLGERDQPLLHAARVLRAVSARGGRSRSGRPGDSASVLFQRLAAAVERVGPIVLAIDDLHRVDAASLGVVAAVADGTSDLPIHLVVSARAALSGIVAEALDPRARHIPLALLSATDLEDMGFDDAWEETGGHPATLAACLAAAGRGGILNAAEMTAVTARVDELAPAHRDVLALAAGAATPMTWRSLATRSGQARSEVESAVTAARNSGLAVVEGQRVRVIPDIVRRALSARING